jgi:integrase/recombinase XerC
MTALVGHYEQRGNGSPQGQILRYRGGRPVGRRYDRLWRRIGEHLPWAAVQQISVHWLRHTTLTWVERQFSYAVARAFAGHAGGSSEVGTTVAYVKATPQEVAQHSPGLPGNLTHSLPPAH